MTSRSRQDDETSATPPAPLSELERAAMEVIWERASATAEQVRLGLEPQRVLKDSTVRTVLRRLEAKGFLGHDIDGRTYVYRSRVRPGAAAAAAVRRIIDRFCGGSVEELLVGLVDNRVVTPAQLRRLEELIDQNPEEGDPVQSTSRWKGDDDG